MKTFYDMFPSGVEVLSKNNLIDQVNGKTFRIEVSVVRLGPNEYHQALGYEPIPKSEWQIMYNSLDEWEQRETAKRAIRREWQNKIAKTLGYDWTYPETTEEMRDLPGSLSITRTLEFFTVVWIEKIDEGEHYGNSEQN